MSLDLGQHGIGQFAQAFFVLMIDVPERVATRYAINVEEFAVIEQADFALGGKPWPAAYFLLLTS